MNCIYMQTLLHFFYHGPFPETILFKLAQALTGPSKNLANIDEIT